jgi:hypothetical protein
MAVVVDQAKLVLNTFAAIFQNNLASADLVTWKQYDGEMEDRNRLTISEQVGPRFAVTQTVNGVQDLTAGVQDVVFGSEQFQINQTFNTSMGWGDFQKIRDLSDARESVAIKNAAMNLAERIDAYVMRFAVLASNNWTGTPGNNVSTYDNIAAGYTRLKEEGVEENDIRAILTYGDKQALGSTVVSNNASLADLGADMYRKGFEGTVAGIPTYFTQQLPTLTFGSRAATGTVTGANQNVNYSAVSISGAPGQYLTQTIVLGGLGAGGTIADGEVFTIAGVNAYDNRLGASLGRLQQFRVVGPAGTQPGATAYTADGTGAATVRIFPAMVVPGTGSGGDINVNNANGTVTAAPAAGAVVTWLGTAGAAVRARAIIQKQAIIVNCADLIMPATGEAMRKSLTTIPLSVRMWKDSAFNTGDHRVRFDVALNANVRDRRRVIRVNG